MRKRIRDRGERGALSLEFLLVISALIGVFLLMLQYAVTAHAHRVAQAAAEEALSAASAYNGTSAAGQAAGASYVARLGNLTDASVVVTRTATTAVVTITGKGQQVVPFLSTRITVQVQGPVERFVEAP
jgi:Flp pilus assembly protein TadG